MNNIEVSIILRTKNEEKYLGEVLEKIGDQKYHEFEIIAVDSGSTDNTLEILKKHNIKTICIKPEDFSFGRAINIGVLNCTGKYIINLSAHAIPVDKYWLSNLIRGFSDKSIAGIYGRQLALRDSNPLIKKDLFKSYGGKRKIQLEEHFFSNANCAIRRNLWEDIPFHDELTGSEDYYWAKCVQERGFKILYDPDASVYHSHNETLSQIYNRAKRESMPMKKIDPNSGLVFNFYKLITRSVAISLLDIIWLLKRKEHIRWYFYTPFFRFALFFGYYVGSR